MERISIILNKQAVKEFLETKMHFKEEFSDWDITNITLGKVCGENEDIEFEIHGVKKSEEKGLLMQKLEKQNKEFAEILKRKSEEIYQLKLDNERYAKQIQNAGLDTASETIKTNKCTGRNIEDIKASTKIKNESDEQSSYGSRSGEKKESKPTEISFILNGQLVSAEEAIKALNKLHRLVNFNNCQ